MSIVYNEKSKVFSLDTKNTSYQFRIAEFNFLEHLFYGKKVEGTTEYLPVRIKHGYQANPHEMGPDRSLCLDILAQEYSCFGNSDFRSNAISIINADGSDSVDLRYVSHKIYDDKYELPGMPSFFSSLNKFKTLEVVMEDSCTNIQVILMYSVLEAQDIVTRAVKIINNSKKPIVLNKVCSTMLDFNTDELDVMTFYGSWGNERNVERTSVRHGKILVDTLRGNSSHYQNPAVIICDKDTNENYGNCYGTALVYSGNFSICVEQTAFKQVRMTAGVNPETFSWELQPNESFYAPEAVMTFSSEGFTKLSENLHAAVRNNLMKSKFANKRRPVLINNWEATEINFTQDSLLKIAEKAKELGVEMFVMDDGWFGRRTHEYRGLGDWTCNLDKLPDGLGGFAKKVNEIGLKFGLWIEPEMVNEDSLLYETHPDWCIKIPNRKPTYQRYQLVLDLSRKDVVEYLYETMSSVISSGNIEYIKWDMNRAITDRYSNLLPANRQGELSHRYVLGFYDLIGRLTSRFPDVLFEGCAGGGGRFDLGALYYTPQIWTSDDTDAIERIKIQYGTSFFYPISSMGSHVSVSPNKQTGRDVDFNTRAAVAYFGTFGYELDLSVVSEENQEDVKKQIKYYIENYDTFAFGTYYRLSNVPKEDKYAAWQCTSKDKTRSVAVYVQLKSGANLGVFYLKLKGLDEQKTYLIEELGIQATGSALMYAGVPMPIFKSDNKAQMMTIKAI